MALIHIALQEGFADDTVAIQANGKEIFRQSNVRTRLQTGYANSVEVNVPEGSVNVQVLLPSKHLSKSIDLQVPDRVYIGVSVTRNGEINYRISPEPFGYL